MRDANGGESGACGAIKSDMRWLAHGASGGGKHKLAYTAIGLFASDRLSHQVNSFGRVVELCSGSGLMVLLPNTSKSLEVELVLDGDGELSSNGKESGEMVCPTASLIWMVRISSSIGAVKG